MQEKLQKTKRLWNVRGFRDGDEHQAAALFNQIFNKSITPEQYRWKVIDTPWPVGAPTTWFADANGQLVGQYASTAMRFWLNGEEIPIVHVCDVMTHPDFRRQGILSAVGETAHRQWADEGVGFVIGFPHKGWGSRSGYLNWETMYHANWLWKPLRLDLLLKERLPFENFFAMPLRAVGKMGNTFLKKATRAERSDIEISTITDPGEAFDELWERFKSKYDALVVRDRQWVTYRYASAPALGYSLLLAKSGDTPLGYLALRVRHLENGIVGYITDVFTDPDDIKTRLALIHYALGFLYDVGARAVLTVVARQARLSRPFRLAGFVKRFSAFEVSIVPLQDDLNYEVMRDANRWFSMGGDFDIV